MKKSPDSPYSSREEGPLSSFVGEGIPAIRCISREGSLNRKVERNTRGRATIPKDPKMAQFTLDEPEFLALPRLSPGVWTHSMVAHVTAL